ncbi:MAG: hypothetical protein COW55_12385 [Rhodobacteraceae bacterium CG17_big_fil_post_rev_8_21_14_2_50_65_11]|nr:MAG: hypothetical protein COW55_12385 [Rhodobacteraceae bacterium CG17_big_fil_post_rev_8_21_14_2_50_65_11]
MIRTSLTGLATLLFLVTLSEAQTARSICGERDRIVATLTGHFGETARSWGMGPRGRIIEVFASTDTGTWTITVTAPDGTTCLVASGNAWQDLAQPPRGAPA